MQFDVRPVLDSESHEASEVVQASFALVAADWEPQARTTFLARSSPLSLAEELRKASFAAGAFGADQMLGLILLPNPSLLGLLFVHPQALRQGIGKALWGRARSYIEIEHQSVRMVEVNATANAIPFYRSLGFFSVSTEFDNAASRATRMACRLSQPA
jgi:GNAT superfamily N-acetyltransferase